MIVEEYNQNKKQYYCGKELLKYKSIDRERIYTLLVIDLEEAYCVNVYTNSEIETVFNIHSEVPHKMKAGGQSAQRFSRIRDNEIVKWYKRINSCINNIEGPIYVSINFVYKNRFNKYLHTYNKTKIKQYDKNEYSGLTGIYQYINYLNQ